MLGFNKKNKTKVQLGDKARDTVTGYTGIVVAVTTWLNGCERVTLQPPMDKDGKVPDPTTFDAPQLDVITSAAVPTGPRETGGPALTPTQHRGPSR